MKRTALFILMAILTHIVRGQEKYSLVATLPLSERAGVTTDYLGNIYVFDKGDLKKYDKDGQPTGTFSTRDYGDIGYVDASNALKTLVVYPDFSKAILLDASLSANATIDLSRPGMVPVNIICISRDEGYWVYDETARRLKKVDSQLNTTAEGTDLSSLTGDRFKPDHLQESSQWLFLHDQESGILVFDRYGTYFKTIREDQIHKFQSDNQNLIFLNGSEIISMDVRTLAKRSFLLPNVNDVRSARLAPNRIYIQTGSELQIYSF